MEHVCGVGFIRQSLDLHRSDKLSHSLLGLLDFDIAQSRSGYTVESRSSKQTCMTSDSGRHVRIFLVV